MEKETKYLILPLSHLYYLTQDPNNETGFTIEEIQKLVEENGWDYRIEANITTPVCVPLTKEQELESLKNQLNEASDALKNLKSEYENLSPKNLERKKNKDKIKGKDYDSRVNELTLIIDTLTSNIAEMENL